ncbi:MAG TPA: flagellar motor switch phosphatase FliY [Firmicutes bacterium]|nr:flagellar motor switch phosphatase FliY [Bacillota bacterium]
MGKHLLSQEEIDALLNNERFHKKTAELTLEEKDALGEIGNIAMGSAATAMSQLIGRRVRITTPSVSIIEKERLPQDYPVPHLAVEVRYSQGLEGMNILIMRERDAGIIAQLMLGQDPEEEVELDEIRLSAIGEAMNQMMGSAATAISTMFDKVVAILPPRVELVDFKKEESYKFIPDDGEDSIVRVSFKLIIEGLVDSAIMQLLPLSFAKGMVGSLLGVGELPEPISPPQTPQEGAEPPGEAVAVNLQKPVVHPVQFAPLRAQERTREQGNIDLLLDIPLEVSVELGRTKRLLKEIMELGVGSILELDKLAGEPVDILVNGKLIAQGEVVVIGENFGVRVTNIVGVQERVETLQ